MKDFKMKFRLWLLRVVTPITIWIGQRHLPFTRKNINGGDFLAIDHILQVGDVLVTKTHGELSNLLIPGHWSHAMIYIGNGLVVEAVGKGVVRNPLASAVLSKDEICILSPMFATEEQKEMAAAFAENQVGFPYDYDFKGNNQAFYCSELIYAAYNEATNGETPFKLRDSMGVPTAIPDDIYLANKKWNIEWIKTKDMK